MSSWNAIRDFMTGFVLVSTVIGIIAGLYAWLVNRGKIYSERYERKKAIDKIIKDHSENSCGAREEIKLLSEAINTLAISHKETIDHNRRQDAQIRDSLEEREVLMEVNGAILDWMSAHGANGSTKSAKDRLTEYNRKAAHRFD